MSSAVAIDHHAVALRTERQGVLNHGHPGEHAESGTSLAVPMEPGNTGL